MKENKYEHYLHYIPGVRFWIIMTGVIVTFAALKAASHLVNIILLATFLTAISLAPLNWLKKQGFGSKLASFIIIFSVIIIMGLVFLIIGESVNNFSNKLPVFSNRFEELWNDISNILIKYRIIDDNSAITESFHPSKIIQMAAPIASGFGSVFSGIFVVFLLFVFMITESEIFAKKLDYISKQSSGHTTEIIKQLRNYFGIKTLTSLATGIVIGVSLFFLNVPFPLLWGFLAFILNYIPSIGSFIAAIPAVILAFVMAGPLTGIITVVVYLVFNTIIGNVIEPQLMGRNLGLSPYIVFFSMIFFGYILGPIGMLIATPLTIIIKIILDSREVTRNFGIMLGDGSNLEEIDNSDKN